MFANRRQGVSTYFIPHPFIRKLLLGTSIANPADSHGLSIHLFCWGLHRDTSIHQEWIPYSREAFACICSLDLWHIDHAGLDSLIKWRDGQNKYELLSTTKQQKCKPQQKAQQEYESQKQVEEMTEAESEELMVRKRRAEGTPCTAEHFKEWMIRFSHEMKLQAEQEAKRVASEAGGSLAKKKKEKQVDKSGRITGFMHFTDNVGGVVNWEAMELEAENAQRDEDESDDDDEEARAVADADLFDVDDDDLDDLDFDDDDDDEDDDDEPDI
jgi:hypothetical protein